jgi:hypothetical protein
MSDYGTDIADAPAEPIDTGADAAVPGAAPDLTDEPVDLAEASSVEDLAEPADNSSSDGLPDEGADMDDAVDLGEPPDKPDEAGEAPQDWQEGEIIDLSHDDISDTEPADAVDPADGEDLAESAGDAAGESPEPSETPGEDLAEELASDATDVSAVAEPDGTDPPEPSVEELTEAAREEARPTEELRENYDAQVADLLGSNAPDQADATEVQDAPDQSDAADMGNSPENEGLASALAERGLTLEPVERFDYSDNPILDYRASGQPDEIAYAVTAWNDQIAPRIAAGATREDFAVYDQEHGLEGQQQLAGVYDYMLGDPVWGNERSDGTLNPGGGRHRLEQARENGIKYLPYKSHGSES